MTARSRSAPALLAVGALLALGALGCGSVGEPPTAVVAPGDTLGKLAKAHGVTVDELRAWNGVEGDLIRVGDALQVGPAPQRGFLDRFRREPPTPGSAPDPPPLPRRSAARRGRPRRPGRPMTPPKTPPRAPGPPSRAPPPSRAWTR